MHWSSYQKMQYFKDNYLNPAEELKILDVGSYDKDGDYNYGKNWGDNIKVFDFEKGKEIK